MELQGHILIPEFYRSALVLPHVYKWCKTSTVVFFFPQYKINFCFMEKLYFISTDSPSFQTIAKIKTMKFPGEMDPWHIVRVTNNWGFLLVSICITLTTICNLGNFVCAWSQIIYGQTNIKIFTIQLLWKEKSLKMVAFINSPSVLLDICLNTWNVFKKQLYAKPLRFIVLHINSAPQITYIVEVRFKSFW